MLSEWWFQGLAYDCHFFRDADVVKLCEQVSALRTSKDDTGWNLVRLEAVAEQSQDSDSDDGSEDELESQRPSVL